jgi:putative iron-regulated protein
MKNLKKLLFVSVIAIAFVSCKKDPENPSPEDTTTASEALNSFSDNVAKSTYDDLSNKVGQLYQNIVTFELAMTDDNLNACKQSWKDSRSAWEQSEGFLFGPVATENIDPRIDTWPVDFNLLDSVLNGSDQFTPGYIDSLDDALKGFHPIEYLLFGQNGTKVAADFTIRQIEYLKALATNLKSLTTALADSWNPQAAGNYHAQVVNAGSGSSVYTTKRAAFEELVNAMAGICDEVANGKISEPFTMMDPSLEESPFSSNSITDFTNNIKSVENVYLGKYAIDGAGLENLVRQHNLTLDGNIKNKIASAIAALQNITVPFGQAISQQPTQVQNAIDAINELKAELEDNLLPFVQQYI